MQTQAAAIDAHQLRRYNAASDRKAMRIGVISDTHNPSAAKEPPEQIIPAFKGVELILHAGDIYQPASIDWLERIAPVKGVELGAHAHFEHDDRIEEMQVLELEGHTIGMVHDLMLPGFSNEVTAGVIAARMPAGFSIPNSVEKFFGKPADIVVFGHTHYAVVEEHQGVLFINPGSPSLPRHVQGLGQVAILEISPTEKRAWLIELSDFS